MEAVLSLGLDGPLTWFNMASLMSLLCSYVVATECDDAITVAVEILHNVQERTRLVSKYLSGQYKTDVFFLVASEKTLGNNEKEKEKQDT